MGRSWTYVSPVAAWRRPRRAGPFNRPWSSARPRRPTLLMGNGKGFASRFLGGSCGRLGDPCGRPKLPRRDADEALEVMGEHTLVREAGVRGDLRQGEVAASL